VATRPLPKAQQRPQPPRLRVISGGARGLSVGAVILLVLTVFCVAALQAYAAQQGFRVASLERQVQQAEQQTTLLQAREAQLANPSRLADEAAKLGLVGDPSPTFLKAPSSVDDGDVRPSTLDAIHRLLNP
jgi:Tfp pilus assembly protein PilV